MKVFIGLNDVSSIIGDLEKGFNNNGRECLTATLYDNSPFAPSTAHIHIPNKRNYYYFQGIRPKRIQLHLRNKFDFARHKVFNKAMVECDTFVFIVSSFNHWFEDLEILKKEGKKIVFIFVGDDARWYPAMKQQFIKYGMRPGEYSKGYVFNKLYMETNFSRVRMAEKYGDLILSLPNQSQIALKPYYHSFLYVDLEMFQEQSTQRKIPTIIHAPSDSGTKGSKYILAALDKLKEEGIKFNLVLLKNKPYSEAIKLYHQCDILLGQVIFPSGGKQERELLACGKIVLSRMPRNIEDIVPYDCPIIDISPETVYEKTKEIILNYDKRIKLAKKSRPWVEKWGDVNTYTKNILTWLDTPEKERKYDYYPTFFRDEFIPESKYAIKQYNKFTQKVMDCDWYKKHIQPGERAGLKF